MWIKRLRHRFARLTLALFVPVITTIAAVSCRTAGSRDQPTDREPYLISSLELESSSRTTVYDVVFETRPRWLNQTRTSRNEPNVYLDDQIIGNATALKRFHPTQVVELRYLSATEAQVRFGQRNGGRPAIVILLDRN